MTHRRHDECGQGHHDTDGDNTTMSDGHMGHERWWPDLDGIDVMLFGLHNTGWAGTAG